MEIKVSEERPISLDEYARISIAFSVTHQFDVDDSSSASGEIKLELRQIETPYVKNYDLIPGNHPTDWPGKFDVTNWGILIARVDGMQVGGCVLAHNTPGVNMLESRHDLAVLWDLRVAPEWRGRGVGSALFKESRNWARLRGCRQLKIETQNNNVSACRFYQLQGCRLEFCRRNAYQALPEEIQLIWRYDLEGAV